MWPRLESGAGPELAAQIVITELRWPAQTEPNRTEPNQTKPNQTGTWRPPLCSFLSDRDGGNQRKRTSLGRNNNHDERRQRSISLARNLGQLVADIDVADL